MIRTALAALLLLAFGGDEKQPAPQPQPPPARPPIGSITVHQQIIIRVPAGFRPGAPPAETLVEWRESHGPRCIAWSRIAGATFPRADSVDLVLRDNTRVRARLERRCPALDYYRGFYVPATPDGLICADRDSFRSRAGGECEIDQFRNLQARPARRH